MIFQTCDLKDIPGKTVLRTREVLGGFLILFTDGTYLSAYGYTNWEDQAEVTTHAIDYAEDVKRKLGLIP